MSQTAIEDDALAEPTDIRSAPGHPDPYPFYSRLARERPLYREGEDGPFVAAGAAAARAVLTSPLTLVRPAGPPPPGIAASPIAEIFTRMARKNDGEVHPPARRAVAAALEGLETGLLADSIAARTASLAASIEPEREIERLTRFIAALPTHVVAGLLGVPAARFADVGGWVGQYGAAVAAAETGVPPATAALMESGADGAARLLELFRGLFAGLGEGEGSLLAALARAGGGGDDLIIANAIGLMVQAFAATSSLIGLTLLALARHPAALAAVSRDPALLAPAVQETLRCDPVAQSVPRFVSSDGLVAGQPMAAGDMIIVVLAAANRDPLLNPDPDRFDIFRVDRQYLAFGAGVHICPGDKLAARVAQAGVERLLLRGLAVAPLAARVKYRASPFIRTPVFA